MRSILGWGKKVTPADVSCLLMAKLGLSIKAISEHCGLSAGQVSYRCKVAGVKLRDYRNGHSDFSQRVIVAAEQSSRLYIDELKGEIQRLLAHPLTCILPRHDHQSV